MPDHEVIIAGAGPVGMLMGCLLAGYGIDVIVCERDLGIDDRTRAIGVHPPGLAALDAAGVGGQIRREAVTLERGEVYARGRMRASVPLQGRRRVLTIAQRRTDALLRDRLHTLGVTVRDGCEVLAVRPDDEQVAVRMRFAGVEQEVTASYLVAADGVRSRVRESLGIRWLRRPGAARYWMIDIPDPDDSPVARLFCEPAGLVESFPLPDGRRRWVARHSDGGTELTAGAFADEIRARTGIRIVIPDAAQPTQFLARQHRAQRAVQGRIALLGDAAHEVSPIGGQGMNLAWVDALRLADVVARAVVADSGELAGYEREASRAVAAVHRRSAFYMSMGAPAGFAAQRTREAMIRLLGSAPLRRATAWMLTMGGL